MYLEFSCNEVLRGTGASHKLFHETDKKHTNVVANCDDIQDVYATERLNRVPLPVQ